jgi:uncharacterized protein (DUF427 family)
VGIQQRDVHVLDAPVGLHSPEHPDELVEDLDGALLTAADRRSESDEYGSIRHADSLLSLDALNLSDRPVHGKGLPGTLACGAREAGGGWSVMSIHVRELLMRELPALRYEPIDKRIRGVLGGNTVVDSTRALLVWEPRRVVPDYAFPEEDVRAEVVLAPDGTEDASGRGVEAMGAPRLGDRIVLDPSVPFSVRTTEGEPLTLRAGGREAAAFRPADPELHGHLILEFGAFDAWYEEDERNVAHPRDPFHRIDIVHGSRHVRVELAGEVLAETRAPYLLFEPPLPVRYYLPPEDVRTDLLQPSDSRTFCAYKGEASYLSHADEPDVAWYYPAPLREAAEVTDRIAFFNELVDIEVDGERLGRPVTPWSKR